MKRVQMSVLLLAAAGLCGCGSNELSPVSGVVTIDGAPFADAIVLYTPEEGSTGLAASGATDSQGRFTMLTRGTESGVRPGKYKVVIDAVDKDAPRAGHPSEAFGKMQAANPNKKIDGAKEYKKMEADAAKAARKKPHTKYGDPTTTPLTTTVPQDRTVKFEITTDGK